MTLFRNILLLFCVMALLSSRVHAQVWVLSTKLGHEIDSVTVGSRAGYAITYDPVLRKIAFLNPSVFDWKFKNITNILPLTGSTSPLSAVDAFGFYTDTAISVIMPSIVGVETLTVHEKSMPKIGTGCSDPNGQKLPIRILPRPKIELVNTTNIPSSTGSIDIPVKLNGYGPWLVTVEIKYNDNTTQTIEVEVGKYGDNPGASTPLELIMKVLPSQPDNINTITILNVGDRISAKSLDQDLVKSQANELPTNRFFVKKAPKPKTYHIKNK